ncbi:DcrB-related protein [Yersinia sp. 2553 StPb PI]|uniref:DcrB-related protein n=1 Tax=Yersinia sp. 2553 StPb PI TaxID=3117411 RepID=UPI0009F548FA|nr:DUF1795 domain-containing protein [Yersinia enterocolitica]
MLKIVAKLTVVMVLVGGLAACDNSKESKESTNNAAPASTPATTPAPAPVASTPAVTPPAATTPAAKLSADQQQVSLFDGKVTFVLPTSFVDQTKLAGDVNNEQNQTLLLIDAAGKQMAVTAVTNPPGVELLDTSDLSLDALNKGLLQGFSAQYQNIKQTGQKDITVDGHKFRLFDTKQKIQNSPMVATTIFTVLDKKVVFIQMVSAAEKTKQHQTLVNSVVDSIALH